MKIHNLLAVGFITIALNGCGTPRVQMDWADSSAISTRITATKDEFKKETLYLGPQYSEKRNSSYVLIRAWKDANASNKVEYQIYVKDWYPGKWRFYNSAYDSNGNALDFSSISRKVDSCQQYGCSFEEHVGLNVSRDYLIKNQASGIRFKLSGTAGETILFLPAAYIKAFVDFTQ